MRQLDFPFTKNGWTHELLRREGLVCLVRRHKKGGSSQHFEVVVLKEREERTFERAGSVLTLKAQEVYPSNEEWGKYGFTYRSPKEAQKRFESLLERTHKNQWKKPPLDYGWPVT